MPSATDFCGQRTVEPLVARDGGAYGRKGRIETGRLSQGGLMGFWMVLVV